MNKSNLNIPKWQLIKSGEGKYGLRYEPGVLGDKGALIRISEEVYLEAAKMELSLNELFEKFDLHNNEKLYEIGSPINLKPKENTPTKFYGKGFIVEQIGNRYFLHYQLARHGGGSRRFEINEEIYTDARTGKYATSNLFKKYNLYHLDDPENDVK